jgi:hypothetical protein
LIEQSQEDVLAEVFDLLSPAWTAELLKNYGHAEGNDAGVLLDELTPRVSIAADARAQEPRGRVGTVGLRLRDHAVGP